MGLLDGRFAIITGAASPRGLGKATARLFADHGATVAILDLDAGQAEAAAAELGEGHVGLACDVTDKAACEAAAADLVARWQDRHSGEQCRHHSAAEDHGNRG